MKRDKFIKWFKGCGIMLAVGLILLTAGAFWGMPRYQKWVNRNFKDATFKEDIVEMKKWIKFGADVNQPPNMEAAGTMLTWAIRNQKNDIAKLLIENGVDTNIKTNISNYPIGYAKTPEQVKLLIDAGAKWKKREFFLLCNALDNGGLELLKYYIEIGANPNAKSSKGITPLHFISCYVDGSAISEKALAEEAKTRIAAIKILIAAGADINAMLTANVTEFSITGSTPLHFAVRLNKLDSVDILLEQGARVDVIDANGNTPLDYAEGKCKALIEGHLKKLAESKK